jgi:hypothetical protein
MNQPVADPKPLKTPGVLAENMFQLLRNCGQTRASQIDAIKMLCATYNSKVVSNFASTGVVSATSSPKAKKLPPVKKTRSPEEKRILEELDEVKDLIKKTGRQLEESDELIMRRDDALHRLRIFRAKGANERVGQAVPLPGPTVPKGVVVDLGKGQSPSDQKSSVETQRATTEDSKDS